ncbi:hypothetical protein [Kitasatospora sp. NPDC051914]|uniref:hypothetical protein n=1 Tax=Kitasatospora sp. NPDC051914 TaxID=3154945 RepID=UPI00341AFC88
MALIDIDTEDLEVLVEATLNNRSKPGMELLNVLRVANGKPAHPANYSRGDLNNIEPAVWSAALDELRAACTAE